MKIGIFSVISWSFLDQRPQMLAKKTSEWGHEVIYFEPFTRYDGWDPEFNHPWEKYEKLCYQSREVYPNVTAMMLMNVLYHKRFEKHLDRNQEYNKKNIEYLKSLNLDLAIIIEPCWGEVCKEAGIPFIYDHVDDTHHMKHVIKDQWYNQQVFSEKNSLATMHIQPNIAQRYNGLYVPNGILTEQLNISQSSEKYFDAGCLSALADWFDIESVLKSKKNILLIGPMEGEFSKKYQEYLNLRSKAENRITWIPKVTRTMGAKWLSLCKTGIIPFDDTHGIVDYVMPLKLVEYYYLGLTSVTYLNKGIELEFKDSAYYYSSVGWRGLPSLDEAISQALNRPKNPEELKNIALKFTWDKVLEPLKQVLNILQVDKNRNHWEDKVSSYKKAKGEHLINS